MPMSPAFGRNGSGEKGLKYRALPPLQAGAAAARPGEGISAGAGDYLGAVPRLLMRRWVMTAALVVSM